MKRMRLYMDTHQRENGSFPEQLTVGDFAAFYAQYEIACGLEGVIPLRIHVGFEEGRAFCLNMAESVEAVERAHQRVGLPYDSITEITTATPGDMFFNRG